MNSEDLTTLLRQSATGQLTRTAACPDEHQIAAYVDGTLEPADCDQVEIHLADCEACTGLVGFLSKKTGDYTTEPVPELALVRARRFGTRSASRWRDFVPHLSAAAIVLVAVAALMQVGQDEAPKLEPKSAPATRATRSVPPSKPLLQVLSPTAGATVDADALIIRWTEVPGSHYYEVHIVSESGELIGERRVVQTEWQPMNDLSLRPGAEYYVRIDAFPSEAKAVSSDHIPFSVAKRP